MIYEGGRGKKDDDDDKTQPSHAEAKLETPIAPGPDFPTLSHAGLSPSSSSFFGYKRLRARVMGGIRSRHFVPCSSFEFSFRVVILPTRQTEIETWGKV